jgi:Uma2 family endonuclease
MSVQYARFHFNADQFERLVETGILTEDDRVELIDGELITMSPIGSRHVACVNALTTLLVLALRERGIVSIQNPVRLDDSTEPLPDVSVLRPKRHRYRDALPRGKDVLIAVEVADTTALYDRTVKIPRYAASGVKEAWLIDLQASVVEVYWAARGGPYKSSRVYGPGEIVASPGIRDLSVEVDAILP